MPKQLSGYGLFLISQSKVSGYDTYDSAVVVAVDEEGAKHVSPLDYYVWHNNGWCYKMADGSFRELDRRRSDWCQPKDVTATWIGIAGTELKLGEVVCASFNAG
jgi:hypothetical protein